jgi:hypothetical protein
MDFFNNQMTIGFSTGSLAKGDFLLALSYMNSIEGVGAIELSSLRESELEALVAASSNLDLEKYSYVSFHAPSQLAKFNEKQLIHTLQTIKDQNWRIIVHPDIIKDHELWRGLGSYLCIENMDKRKSAGRTVDSLEQIFNLLPEATFCLDIAHSRQVDPTMRETAMMLDCFGSRLSQIHISNVNSQSIHEPLDLESIISFTLISRSIPRHVPIIIESPVSHGEMALEVKKVKLIFKNALINEDLNRSHDLYSQLTAYAS